MTEYTQDEADALMPEHIAALGNVLEGFMRETGLRFGYTLVTFDRLGIKTMGNMPPEAQAEMFTVIALKLADEGPEEVTVVPLNRPGTH